MTMIPAIDAIAAMRFEKAVHIHTNTSGIEPLDMRVVVLPDPAEKRSSGGIILPDANIEQKEWAQMKGTLVAVGQNAWCEAKAARGFEPPEPGTRVLFAKYGGVTFDGDDGKKYRIMNDEDVTGILKEN